MSDKKNHFITSLTYPLKASSPRKIAVIGGGIAGMEAASTAAEGGHAVELFDAFGETVARRSLFRHFPVPENVVGQQVAAAVDERAHRHFVVLRILPLVPVDKDQVEYT